MQKNEAGRRSRRRFLLEGAAIGVTTAAATISLSPADAGEVWGRSKRQESISRSSRSLGDFGFVIHGGAGAIPRAEMSKEMEADYRSKLSEALMAGYEILRKKGDGLDAVEAAIRILEDSPLFNAGKGGVFTSEGTIELDASIMDGRNLKAGAVSTLKRIKNPISLARLVMEKSPHVMMVGEGAEAFARQHGVAMMPQSYFFTERRWRALQKIKEEEKRKSSAPDNSREKGRGGQEAPDRVGTVGAVALDRQGNLSAGTSTGGMTNKRFGRVGDSPIIGAGTYANNRTCAVSATGDGEYFIRSAASYDISALVEYRGLALEEAARTVIEKIGKLGGTGGVIAIDARGQFAMPFNSEGMYRGAIGADGKVMVQIYKD